MDVKLEDHWKDFVEHEVDRGRFESADAVVAEGLRLVEERESKLKALRDVIETSLLRGGEASEDDIDRALAARADELRRAGGDTPLEPGMAVTTEIKTGKRTVISYLLSPLFRFRQEGLRER